MKKISNSISETHKLASGLAKKILKQKNDKATVVALIGELGSGKTVFTKGFAKSLAIKEHITSPTFVILKKYQIPNYKSQTNSKFQITKFKTLVHIDAYRINKFEEILNLGWEEIVNNPENIILIEWADNVRKILPKRHCLVNFSHKDVKKRTIDITHKK